MFVEWLLDLFTLESYRGLAPIKQLHPKEIHLAEFGMCFLYKDIEY